MLLKRKNTLKKIKKYMEIIMAKFTHILLDLDGTLTDPEEGITRAVACALDSVSMPYDSLESLQSFIGPPLDQSLLNYGVKEKDVPTAITQFREYYANKGIYECKMFEGVPELLKTLKAHDKKIFLATSKIREYAHRVLDHFEITPYFDFISGSEFDGTRTAKAEVITFALEETKTPVSSSIVMIGDRKHDIFGAKHNNITAVGVLYGFGSREEFESENADYIINTMEDLKQFLIL